MVFLLRLIVIWPLIHLSHDKQAIFCEKPMSRCEPINIELFYKETFSKMDVECLRTINRWKSFKIFHNNLSYSLFFDALQAK